MSSYSKKSELIQLLMNYPEYRRQYVKYKAKIEHRGLPKSLLRDLPYEIVKEMIELWEKEVYEYNK